jgi:hypothetical protein
MKYYRRRANGIVTACDSIESAQMTTEERRVALTTIGDITVSTVFLGIDHNWSGEGPPVLWETMIFGMEDEPCWRYSSEKEALEGHEQAVLVAEEFIPPELEMYFIELGDTDE